MVNIKERFCKFDDYILASKKKGKNLTYSEFYEKWESKLIEHEDIETDVENIEKLDLPKWRQKEAIPCKHCNKKIPRVNIIRHKNECLGVKVFLYFVQGKIDGLSKCNDCLKVFTSRNGHECRENKLNRKIIDCEYCKFNFF